MTLGCVRCHDHKFDPLVLSDYYGIAGMLRSSPSTHKIPFGGLESAQLNGPSRDSRTAGRSAKSRKPIMKRTSLS